MRDLHDGTMPGFRYCNSEFCVNRCRAGTARDADLDAVSLNITGITVITVISHPVIVRAAEYLNAVDLEMCAEIRLDGKTGRRAALGTATRPATASASVDAAVASTRCVWPGPPLQLKQRIPIHSYSRFALFRRGPSLTSVAIGYTAGQRMQ